MIRILIITCIISLLSVLTTASMAAGPEKIILDTDIGDDVDDAYALALLVNQPNVKVLGVTTAFGETRERAELAAKMLNVMGHGNVPVYAGRRGEAKIRGQYAWAKGYTAKNLKTTSAVEFIKQEIEKAPGEVTLCAVGPLTNLGDLFSKYPETKTKIKRIVIMGGAVLVGYGTNPKPEPEWNIKCDPSAAKAVYESGVPLVMAGLEVTAMMQLEKDRRMILTGVGTPTTDALAALTYLWENQTPTLFDPVAVAYACGHKFSDEEKMHVIVEDNGLTRITPGTPNVTVLVKPKKEEFLNWYLSIFTKK